MQLAIISPPNLLELSALRPGFGMVLPEGIVLSEDYVRFYRDLEGYKILDNGIVEGHQYTATELHHMAYDVSASCIVVPDQFRDADRTVQLARDFERHRNPDLDYMGVLQGLELGDILKCLRFFNNCEWITHIGLPRILCEFHKYQRVSLVEIIRDEQNVGNYRPFAVHALGASPWIEEIKSLVSVGCDSMDTSLPVVMGLAGLGLDRDYVSREPDFMHQTVDRASVKWRTLVENCIKYIEWSGYTFEPSE